MCESSLGGISIQLNTGLDTERESGNCTLFQNNYMEARIFFLSRFKPVKLDYIVFQCSDFGVCSASSSWPVGLLWRC